MKMTVHIHAAARGGFTIVELLVSSAVLAIVLSVMFAALSTGLSLWRNTDNKILADREARAIELVLMRDLANIVMPASSNLWPRIDVARRGTTQYLKFLTTVPAELQGAAGAQSGDVCYVEYAVVAATNLGTTNAAAAGSELRRFFLSSSRTFTDVIRSNAFPMTNEATNTNFLSLGINLLPSNSIAARGIGSGSLSREVRNTNFIFLGPDMLQFRPPGTASNYPVAIEVNFAVADPETLANSNLLSNPNAILRNAGLYSFRIPLPKPPNAP
jgi:prepilin-type N-terminal cleavage/methylation domain-containing protein